MKARGEIILIRHLTINAADGVNLHGVQSGEKGRVMLFLHGFPEFWQAWHRQLEEFSGSYRATAADLRGYNLSDKPPDKESYALPRIVEDIRHVIRTLSPDQPVILVGHDWGGIVGWILGHESPELLERLVIINAPHPAIFDRELRKPAQLFSSSYAAFFQLRGVAETVLRAFHFAALRAMIFGTSAKPQSFSAELRAAYREAWNQPGALTAGLNYYRNVRVHKSLMHRKDWRIPIPVLVLWGERDLALRRSNLKGISEQVPRVVIKVHPRATHWIVHEEPEWVNAQIRSFVAEKSS